MQTALKNTHSLTESIQVLHQQLWGSQRGPYEIAILFLFQSLNKLRHRDSAYMETIISSLVTWGKTTFIIKLLATNEHCKWTGLSMQFWWQWLWHASCTLLEMPLQCRGTRASAGWLLLRIRAELSMLGCFHTLLGQSLFLNHERQCL